MATDESIREIASGLCRTQSTISREINRNDGYDLYRASHADKAAWEELGGQSNASGHVTNRLV
ncbi:helix-turn-helix domain-containing protein [Dasania marina]|uniref:helix-turn-helix domain-containing protein n=1 Tax=Dasania marina TaxID=471499 RepID=UPI0030D9A7A4